MMLVKAERLGQGGLLRLVVEGSVGASPRFVD